MVSGHPVVSRASPSSPVPDHLYQTIYLSDSTLDTRLAGQVGQGADRDSHDMLSVAVKIQLDSKQNNKVWTINSSVKQVF